MKTLILWLVALSSLACGRYVPAPGGDAGPAIDGGASALDAGAPACDPLDTCPTEYFQTTEIACLPYQSSSVCSRLNRCVPEPGPWCHVAETCFALPSCPPTHRESEVPCGLDEEQCTTAEACGLTVFCRPEMDCDAEPTCQTGTPSHIPCGIDEPDCQSIYQCAEALWCRGNPEGCRALPTCNDGWVSTQYPCVANELHCERSTACGSSIFCRQ